MLVKQILVKKIKKNGQKKIFCEKNFVREIVKKNAGHNLAIVGEPWNVDAHAKIPELCYVSTQILYTGPHVQYCTVVQTQNFLCLF